MLEPGEIVRIDGGTVNHTIITARYDEEDRMAWYRLADLAEWEIPGSRITGVVSHG